MTTDLKLPPMKYYIDNEYFATKNQVKSKVRSLLGPYKKAKKPLDGKARSFLFDLLKHHDEWNNKTQGRPDDEINLVFENMWVVANQPSYGLRIYFGDDLYRGDDISWVHAVLMLSPNVK